MKHYLSIYLSIILTILFAGCKSNEPEAEKTLEGISLNKQSIEIEVGQDYQLRVWYEPEEAEDQAPEVVWESSKTKVAIVDEKGKVHAKEVGKTTITATCGKFSAECSVEVVPEPEPVAVESILLSETSVDLIEGQSLQLFVSYIPEESERHAAEIEWSSSDETVATVSEGFVEAIKEGTATITAKCGTISATCEVKVVEYNNDIIVNPKSIVFPSTGGQEMVQVVSSTPWTATTEADWLSISPTEGTGTQQVSISVKSGVKQTMLTASITFANTENTTTVVVTKEGKVMSFSASAATKVLISQGNVQVVSNSPKVYKFAEAWEIERSNQGLSPSKWNDTNAPNNEIEGYDKGIWRMYTYDEIMYIVEQRPNADKLRGAGTIGDRVGYIFLPDEWEQPDGLSFTAGTSRPGDNKYTTQEWAKMAEAGAVFFAWSERYYGYWTSYISTSRGKDSSNNTWLYGLEIRMADSTNNSYNLGHSAGDVFYNLSQIIDYNSYTPNQYYIRLIREVE